MSKVAVVTGGTSGIGKQTALALKAAGYTVYELSRRAQGVEGLHHLVADITREELVDAAIGEVLRQEGHIDVVVNNAGINIRKTIEEMVKDEWMKMMEVNTASVFLATKYVLPVMRKQGGGAIINTSSIWGLRGASCEVTYSCTKAALIGLTRSLAAELAPTHIRVNCVAPGVIRTDMLDALPAEILPQLAQETPMGRLGTPEDIAHAVAFLASDKADFITGQVLTCDGGFIL